MTVESFRFYLVMCLGIVVGGAIVVRLRGQGRREARWLQSALWASAGVVVGYLFENLSGSLEAKIFWDGLQLSLDGVVAAAYLMFAARYSGRPFRSEPRSFVVSLLPPVLGGLVAATAPWHGFMRRDALIVADPMRRLTYSFELIDYLVFAQIYGFLFISLGLFVLSGFLDRRVYRAQTIFLFLAAGAPASGALLIDRITVLGERDLSPFLFALGAIAATLAVVVTRAFHLVPMARDVLVESMGDAVLVTGFDGQLVDANPSARRIIGSRSWLGGQLSDIWPEASLLPAPVDDAGVRVSSDGKVWELRRYPIGAAGHVLIGRDVTSLARSEQALEQSNLVLEQRVLERTEELQLAVESLHREVMTREAAEKASLENERRFRATFDNAQQLLALLDAEGRIVAANLAVLGLAEVLMDEVAGKPLMDLPWWRDSAQARAQLRGALAVARSGRFTRFEAQFSAPHELVLDCSLKPLLRQDQAAELLFEAHDMTTIRRAERQRAELAAANQQADRMNMLGRLAGSVAHDFNNLLGVILAGTSYLRHGVKTTEDEGVLADIEKATQSAALVTRQLLSFSHSDPGNPEPTDVHETATRMAKLMTRLLGEQFTLELSLAPERPYVLIDTSQLERCLMNLVVNARDAMPGGGTVSVRSRIDKRSETESSERVVLAVQDHGIGMTEEIRRRIFEPFFTTKARGQGTGIGLATVRQIVTDAGGSIEVASEVGAGTTVELSLPLCDPKSSSKVRFDRESLVGSEVVVFVEDLSPLRELIARELRHYGYDVHTFSSAERAEDGLARASIRPDCLVTDVVLPGKDGVQLARDMLAVNPDLAVIYTTGYSGDVSLEGATGQKHSIVFKPYRCEALAASIRALRASA